MDQVLVDSKNDNAKTQAANDAVVAAFEAYKQEQERGLRDIVERTAKSTVDNEMVMQTMVSTAGEMKHIIKVKENLKE